MMAEKRAKSEVNYSLGGEHCHACVNFINENEKTEMGECKLVAGPINPHYWCELFKRMRDKNMGTAGDKKAGRMRKRGMISDKAMAKNYGE